MQITVFAAGSRGDVQPCVVLSRELQRAGYNVRLAAPQDFSGFAQEHGVVFHPLRGDVQQIMAGETGREFIDHDIVDGAPAARFAQRLKELIESGYGLHEGAHRSTSANG